MQGDRKQVWPQFSLRCWALQLNRLCSWLSTFLVKAAFLKVPDKLHFCHYAEQISPPLSPNRCWLDHISFFVSQWERIIFLPSWQISICIVCLGLINYGFFTKKGFLTCLSTCVPTRERAGWIRGRGITRNVSLFWDQPVIGFCVEGAGKNSLEIPSNYIPY